jgi:hypothetical protein
VIRNVGAGEDDLISGTIPANLLATTGFGVRITAKGTTANNANAKTLKLYFDTAVILTNSLTVSVAGKWITTAEVYSTGTDAQDYFASLIETGTGNSDIENGTATENDGAANHCEIYWQGDIK